VFDQIEHIAIFISHEWWNRAGAGGDGVGTPDHIEGRKANLKWRLIRDGVKSLAKQEGLSLNQLVLWMDSHSISQDNDEEKNDGVTSMIQYMKRCSYMLVPTEERKLQAQYPEHIPGYGKRAWCRCEYLLFSLWAMLRGEEVVNIYALTANGAIHPYSKVKVLGAQSMPCRGELTVEADREMIRALEDEMVDVYGAAIVEKVCRAERDGGVVDLSNKMLRASSVPSIARGLLRASMEHMIKTLDLSSNQLGAEGAAALAPILAGGTLMALDLRFNDLGPEGARVLAPGIAASRSLVAIDISYNELDQAAAIEVLMAIKGKQMLSIRMTRCELGVEGARMLAELLPSMGSIGTLVLQHNNIGSEGASLLAPAIAVCSSLTNCDVRYNGISGAGATLLSAAVLANTNIDRFNDIPIKEMRADTFTEIDLNGSSIGEEGSMVVAGLLPAMESMESMDLSGNTARSQAAQALVERRQSWMRLQIRDSFTLSV